MAWFDRLKQARSEKHITQAELGASIGVAKSTVAGYEKGSSQPDVAKLSAIMDVLNVDANFLFQDEMQKPDSENNVQRNSLLDKYDRLNTEGQEKLLDYADDLVSSGKYKPSSDDDAKTYRIAARNGADTITLNKKQREELIKAVENAGDPPAGVF